MYYQEKQILQEKILLFPVSIVFFSKENGF